MNTNIKLLVTAALTSGLILTTSGAAFARNMGTHMRMEQNRVNRQHVVQEQRTKEQKEKKPKEPKKPKEKKVSKSKKSADTKAAEKHDDAGAASDKPATEK